MAGMVSNKFFYDLDCGIRAATINNDDFFECLSCHTQYTCGCWGDDSWEEVVLIDEAKDNIFDAFRTYRVLPTKGKGDFPVEKELRCRINNAKRAQGRILRLLKAMRRHIGNEEIYFNGAEFTIQNSSVGGATVDMLMKQKYCICVRWPY